MLESILIVDDDPSFVVIAERIVKQLGVAVVTTAGNAERAMTIAHASRPASALVDVRLPDGSGIDLAYALSDLAWKPVVVLTSSDGDAPHVLDARGERRRLPFIAKEELVSDTLRQALARPSCQ